MPESNVLARHFGGQEFTPEQVLLQALAGVADIDQIVIATTNKEGVLQTGWSSGDTLQNLVGLLEFAKLEVMESARK